MVTLTSDYSTASYTEVDTLSTESVLTRWPVLVGWVYEDTGFQLSARERQGSD